MENQKKLNNVIASVFNIEASSVNEDTSVDTVESWDSLNHLKLILALEQEFDISFTEEETVELLNYPLIKITLTEHGVQF